MIHKVMKVELQKESARVHKLSVTFGSRIGVSQHCISVSNESDWQCSNDIFVRD
jgi:hypothetical protein